MICTHESGRSVSFSLTRRIPEQAVRLIMRFDDRWLRLSPGAADFPSPLFRLANILIAEVLRWSLDGCDF
jgi:hypothetical protein